MERNNRLKEDSMLLMRGFDSVANTLSMLSNNLDNALQVCLFTTINLGKRACFGYYVILVRFYR